MRNSSTLKPNRKWLVFKAAADFFFLQNRSYPRTAALELAGNRYNLDATERMLLQRGLFGQKEALSRRAKKISGESWQGAPLFVDGHNVQITIESHIGSRLLIKANDGTLRDLAGQSARFRLSETSNMAMDMVFRFFDEFRPKRVVFLFDEPMSHSGEIASLYRTRIKKAKLTGDARAVPVPEREFPYDEATVASSDGAVVDSSVKWMDLACRIIELFGSPEITVDFSPLILSRLTENHLFGDDGPFW